MRMALLGAAALLAGCSITLPVAVIGERGDILTGTSTATLTSGTYTVSNGVLTCAGSYDPNPSLAVSFTTTCNDGRRGFGQAIRDAGGQSGQGQLRLDDGEGASFLFGRSAASFTPKVRQR